VHAFTFFFLTVFYGAFFLFFFLVDVLRRVCVLLLFVFTSGISLSSSLLVLFDHHTCWLTLYTAVCVCVSIFCAVPSSYRLQKHLI
jgi:hypothetical protein